MNSSKGVVRSSELSPCTLDQIKSHLEIRKAVTDVKQITFRRNAETISTNTYNIVSQSIHPQSSQMLQLQKNGHHETEMSGVEVRK